MVWQHAGRVCQYPAHSRPHQPTSSLLQVTRQPTHVNHPLHTLIFR